MDFYTYDIDIERDENLIKISLILNLILTEDMLK